MSSAGDYLAFHHVQMYVDSLKPLADYKALEETFSKFSADVAGVDQADKINAGRAVWEKVSGAKAEVADYAASGQDVVEQMIAGLGWRVTGEFDGPSTTSLLVTSPDASGAKFVMTTRKEGAAKDEKFDHFSAHHVNRFYGCHADRAGVAVMCFESTKEGAVAEIYGKYKENHPNLLVNPEVRLYEEGNFQILDVFAYYDPVKPTEADEGTVLRFVERKGDSKNTVLPGLNALEASYPKDAYPAFSDHWVSNVVNRQQFLDTLNSTLGFTPKVDFNAGVVAAGQAIIESTVTGNTAPTTSTNKAEILVNQQQVYLPINNALSEVGHVHLFIKEMGQGIQHLASRVEDLVSFISRTNQYREMTGKGLSFLRIPRSYYGRLELSALEKAGCSAELANAVFNQLQKLNYVSITGIADIDITAEQAAEAGNGLEGDLKAAFDANKDAIVSVVLRSRFANLVKLLKDHLSDETYLMIVKNAILVDIQAGDVLYQIFTANILQRKTGEESPFLEFIQRVCSEKKDADGKPKAIRPGCGGFGIRNFLTLFLSIEVSKAMLAQDQATAAGNAAEAEIARRMVELFGNQLDESNPVLTQISDAMTVEADSLAIGDVAAAEAARASKEDGGNKLKEISERYAREMGALRA